MVGQVQLTGPGERSLELPLKLALKLALRLPLKPDRTRSRSVRSPQLTPPHWLLQPLP